MSKQKKIKWTKKKKKRKQVPTRTSRNEVEKIEDLITAEYYDIKKPAAYTGVQSLKRRLKSLGIKISSRELREWLSSQTTYGVMRSARKHYKTPKTIVGGILDQYQADLVDMRAYTKSNEGFQYILTVIDVFSKVAYAEPLRTKSGAEVAEALRRVFLASDRPPTKLQTDAGKEFLDKRVQQLLSEHKVKFFVSQSNYKAAVCERFNRTLKTRMWKYFFAKNTTKWVDILQDLIRAYNDSYHRAIAMQPNQVNAENEQQVWTRLYGGSGKKKKQKITRSKFKVGDLVRILTKKHLFEKGYTQNFSTRLYRIMRIVARGGENPHSYELEEADTSEPVLGSFNEAELQLVNLRGGKEEEEEDTVIDMILDREGKGGNSRFLVKWKDKPKYMAQWIDAKDINPKTLNEIMKTT